MPLRERLEWLTRMTFLLFILASAAFLSAITAMRIAIHGREVTMPNLVGKNVSEASQLLQSRGLVLRVADRIYSDQPINVVLRQTPPAGLLMKVSQQAHVVLSLGQRQLQIPMLEGNSLRASRVELLRQGLQVGEVSAINMPGQSADTDRKSTRLNSSHPSISYAVFCLKKKKKKKLNQKTKHKHKTHPRHTANYARIRPPSSTT